MKKIIPTALVLAGVGILASVFVPIGLSQVAFKTNQPEIIIDPSAVYASESKADKFDDTQIGTWFEGQPPLPKTVTTSKISYYTLSIPRLNLNNVTVEINGTDLKKNSIQYPGTAVPGSFGNTVIFGHSTLPQFYKVGDPVSIFNPLLKAKVGDEVIVNYDGITYRYIVKSTETIKPTKIEVLAQHFDKYELTLITCTPLGTYLNRFVVHAELIN